MFGEEEVQERVEEAKGVEYRTVAIQDTLEAKYLLIIAPIITAPHPYPTPTN